MLGEKAYDSAELRDELHEHWTKPVIPTGDRKQPFSFSKRLHKLYRKMTLVRPGRWGRGDDPRVASGAVPSARTCPRAFRSHARRPRD